MTSAFVVPGKLRKHFLLCTLYKSVRQCVIAEASDSSTVAVDVGMHNCFLCCSWLGSTARKQNRDPEPSKLDSRYIGRYTAKLLLHKTIGHYLAIARVIHGDSLPSLPPKQGRKKIVLMLPVVGHYFPEVPIPIMNFRTPPGYCL